VKKPVQCLFLHQPETFFLRGPPFPGPYPPIQAEKNIRRGPSHTRGGGRGCAPPRRSDRVLPRMELGLTPRLSNPPPSPSTISHRPPTSTMPPTHPLPLCSPAFRRIIHSTSVDPTLQILLLPMQSSSRWYGQVTPAVAHELGCRGTPGTKKGETLRGGAACGSRVAGDLE
jgi:hypothetical protein